MNQFYHLMKDSQNVTFSACAIMKERSINNMKIKCLQFSQNVSDISEQV